jgi:flagellar secretion chaperone FliS
MSDRGRSASVTAYRSVAAHGGVAAADPHRLIVMLMDGTLERIAAARGAIDAGSQEARSRMIQRAIANFEELRASLNMEAGGSIAANLADLYDYSIRQLTRANLEARGELLDEVGHLLREIRSAWIQVPSLQGGGRGLL